jgi:uncharacterized protein (DUF2147 family)
MKSALLFLSIFIISSVYSQNNSGYPGEAILGIYWSPKKDGKIEIFKQDNKYFGKLIWGREMHKKDINNPDPAQRDKTILGLVILRDFYYDQNDNEWKGGTIYDPRSGSVYKSYMWREDENLRVKGYVGISLFGKSVTFEKVKE